MTLQGRRGAKYICVTLWWGTSFCHLGSIPAFWILPWLLHVLSPWMADGKLSANNPQGVDWLHPIRLAAGYWYQGFSPAMKTDYCSRSGPTIFVWCLFVFILTCFPILNVLLLITASWYILIPLLTLQPQLQAFGFLFISEWIRVGPGLPPPPCPDTKNKIMWKLTRLAG